MSVGRVVSRLDPSLIVIGRSVFGRSVRQGTRRNVVSSCSPPESVSTHAACLGETDAVEVADGLEEPHAAGAGSRASSPNSSSRPRVRGWAGNTTGSDSETAPSASTIAASDSRSSTFDGRCSVT